VDPPVLEVDGWGPLHTNAVELRTHPQETTENSVDLGHFPIVHGYRDVKLLSFEADGPQLQTRYSFVRPGGLPPLGRDQEVHIHVHVWGLGFSYVDVTLPGVGVATRQFVLPTPVAADRVELRLGMNLRPTPEAAWFVRWSPRWLFDAVVGRLAMRGYVHDVTEAHVVSALPDRGVEDGGEGLGADLPQQVALGRPRAHLLRETRIWPASCGARTGRALATACRLRGVASDRGFRPGAAGPDLGQIPSRLASKSWPSRPTIRTRRYQSVGR
jgi:hypothetical protein